MHGETSPEMIPKIVCSRYIKNQDARRLRQRYILQSAVYNFLSIYPRMIPSSELSSKSDRFSCGAGGGGVADLFNDPEDVGTGWGAALIRGAGCCLCLAVPSMNAMRLSPAPSLAGQPGLSRASWKVRKNHSGLLNRSIPNWYWGMRNSNIFWSSSVGGLP